MRTIYDPYMDTEKCVERLYSWYQAHKTLIVAFDWDDTCFDFHKKGYRYPEVFEILKECSDLGFTLILFSAKEDGQDLEGIQKMLKEECEINVQYINESPVMPTSKKPYFNILLDDKAGLGQAYEILRETLDQIK